MNNAFRRTTSSLLRYFPFLLFAFMLTLFIHSAFQYSFHAPVMADDFEFKNALKERSISDASFYFYHNFNGRLASHFYLCSVFTLIDSFTFHFGYYFVLLSGFIFSLAHLLQNFLGFFRNKNISWKSALLFAAFITSMFFFITLEGSIEVWFWISSTGVYLVSMLIGMNAFALLLSEKQSAFRISLAAILFFLAGGFSESYAIMYLMLLLFIGFKIARIKQLFLKYKATIIFSIIGIVAGLLINVLSGGANNRLAMLGKFKFLYAFKNKAHSLVLGFHSYPFLLSGILLTGLFLLYAYFRFPLPAAGWNYFIKKSIPVLLFISILFFIPCYILSDIVPYRAASLGYLAGVLFLFDYFIFRSDTFGNKKELPG